MFQTQYWRNSDFFLKQTDTGSSEIVSKDCVNRLFQTQHCVNSDCFKITLGKHNFKGYSGKTEIVSKTTLGKLRLFQKQHLKNSNHFKDSIQEIQGVFTNSSNNNNNGYLKHLTCTGPKHIHIFYMYSLSKFNTYNMKTHTHTHTHTQSHISGRPCDNPAWNATQINPVYNWPVKIPSLHSAPETRSPSPPPPSAQTSPTQSVNEHIHTLSVSKDASGSVTALHHGDAKFLVFHKWSTCFIWSINTDSSRSNQKMHTYKTCENISSIKRAAQALRQCKLKLSCNLESE